MDTSTFKPVHAHMHHAERNCVRRAQRKHAPRLRFIRNRDELARSPRHACCTHRSCFPARPPHPIDRGWTIGHGSKKHKARTRVHACRVRAAGVHVNRPNRTHPHRPADPCMHEHAHASVSSSSPRIFFA